MNLAIKCYKKVVFTSCFKFLKQDWVAFKVFLENHSGHFKNGIDFAEKNDGEFVNQKYVRIKFQK